MGTMLLKPKRSKKLNNQYQHVYTNMMGGKKGQSLGGWVPVYNRMIKDLLFDLQDSDSFPSNEYLHQQMSEIKAQAMRISTSESSDDNDVDWERVISAVKDADLFWDNEFHIKKTSFLTKCFALINEHGLNESEKVVIQSLLGGSHLKDHGVIHVKCVSVIRREPLEEKAQPKYDRAVKRYLLKIIEDEIKSMGESTMLLKEDLNIFERIHDWILLKIL